MATLQPHLPPLSTHLSPVCPERHTGWPADLWTTSRKSSQSSAESDKQWDLTLMRSICILASRNYFGCQAACLIACHSLLSETAASGRCSFSDDLNFHFSDTGLSSSTRDKTESVEQPVPIWLFRGQRANTSLVGPTLSLGHRLTNIYSGEEKMKKGKRR